MTAAVCSALTASALDATSAQVTLDAKQAPKIERVAMPSAATFGSVKPMSAAPEVPWQVVNIPVVVKGKATKRADDKQPPMPHFVNELTIKAYVLIDSDANKGKPVLLSKEITYVDVPLKPKSGTAENEMCVALFIAPSSAVKLNEKTKGDLKLNHVQAVAVEASFKGNNCMNSKEPCFEVYDNKIKSNLKNKWWLGNIGSAGAVACSVAETPFAAYVGNVYPQVATTSAGSSAPSSSATTDGEYTPSISTPATTDEATTTTTTPAGDTTATAGDDSSATPTETADDSSTRRGSKNKKTRKRSR